MATSTTYRFDGSVSITNPSSYWTNPNDAFDNDTNTGASKAGIVGGGFSSNYLSGFGTNAPASHASIILSVELRVYGACSSGDGVGAAVDIGGVQQGPQATARTSGWSPYAVAYKADGTAWVWSDLPGLGVRMWGDTTGSGGVVSPSIREAEIRVTYSDSLYDYPLMNGMSAGTGTASAARYLALNHTNDTAVDTNDDDVYSYIMAPALIKNTFKFVRTTAPGAGITATYGVASTATSSASLTDSAITLAIADPATSNSDTTHLLHALTDHKAVIKQTASGVQTTSLGNRWRLQFQAERQQLWATSLVNLSTTLVRYIGIQDSGGLGTTAAASTQYVPEDGGIKDATVYLQNGALSGGSYACDLFVNGSSVVTLTITSQYAQDTGNTRTWTQGQPVYWQITPSGGTAPTARSFAASGQYMSQDGSATYAKRFILLSSNNSNLTTGNTNYNNWYGNGAWNTTESLVQALGATCTLIGAYGILSADTGAAKTRTVTFRKNTADAATLFTFNNSGTTKTYSGSVSIANDDLINTKQVPSGTPTNATLKYGLVLEANAVTNPVVLNSYRIVKVMQAINRASTF